MNSLIINISIIALLACGSCVAAEDQPQTSPPALPSGATAALVNNPNADTAAVYLQSRQEVAAGATKLPANQLAVTTAAEAEKYWPIGSTVVVGDQAVLGTVLDYKEFAQLLKPDGGAKSVKLSVLIQGQVVEIPIPALRILSVKH